MTGHVLFFPHEPRWAAMDTLNHTLWGGGLFSFQHRLKSALVHRVRPGLAFAMLAWPFHILVDLPIHSRAFFPTPFLWLVSDFAVAGVSWPTPWVWPPNLAGLAVLLTWRLRHSRSADRT